MATPASSYDEVAYPSYARPWTHPDRLATIARLFGMRPASPDHARVLELGCGNGTNLMGIAFHHPGARVVGIDLAAVPLQRGRALAERLNLRNLELCQGDLLTYRPEEKFDYIIAHGLYSWVPEKVRTRILEICREALAEQGVGFISYNLLPGWHLRMPVRDLMLYHGRGIEQAGEKLAAAREIAAAMAEFSPDNLFGKLLREEVQSLAACDERHIYHDDLAEVNQPVYFHEFVAAAARHGLQYLSDTDSVLGSMTSGEAGRRMQEYAAGDFIRAEQYMDFLNARRFRQSMLCRDSVRLDRSVPAASLETLHVASSMPPGPEQPDGSQQFRLRAGCTITTNHPWTKHLLTTLAAAWPSTRPLRDFDGWPEQRDGILRLFVAEALRLRVTPVRAPRHGGERPAVAALTRAEVATGSGLATNLHHFMVDVSGALLRELVPLLDGTRDRAALAAALTSAVHAGRCNVECESDSLESGLAAHIDKALDDLGGSGLLVG